MSRVTVAMPGSCGELVQGIMDGVCFHVTCPVDIYSRVSVEVDGRHTGLLAPESRPKAREALRKTLARSGKNAAGVELTIDSPIPLSKGMASSTADVAGAIEAACLATGAAADAASVAEIAVGVEPSDGIFFPGIVAFDHREGKLVIPLGLPPPLDIIILDCGGQVDTLAFNAVDRRDVLKRQEPLTRDAFASVQEGMARRDALLIGRGATLSAVANQSILFKPHLEKAITVAKEVGAAGVNVGHSGTVIGILLDRRVSDTQAVILYVARKLPELKILFSARLVGGGKRVLARGA
ncbi:MAG: hypothetical protein HY673_08665 [Chloroflexi bacterium]|nr:hypothetical protein [Chloroflexota bacterium]